MLPVLALSWDLMETPRIKQILSAMPCNVKKVLLFPQRHQTEVSDGDHGVVHVF